jgi:hypothetical protein
MSPRRWTNNVKRERRRERRERVQQAKAPAQPKQAPSILTYDENGTWRSSDHPDEQRKRTKKPRASWIIGGRTSAGGEHPFHRLKSRSRDGEVTRTGRGDDDGPEGFDHGVRIRRSPAGKRRACGGIWVPSCGPQRRTD